MDISKLASVANVPSSISELMKQSMNFERQWTDALKPVFELNRRFGEMPNLINSSALLNSQFGATSQLAKVMAGHSSHWKKLTDPLSELRESMLFFDRVTKAMALSSLSWQNTARELSESLTIYPSALRMSDEINKQMAGLSALHLERFAEIAKPFQGLLDSIDSAPFAAITAKEIAAQHNFKSQFQLPVIDSAAANAIAAIWWQEGVERQLKSFGIEYQKLFDDIESAAEQVQSLAPPKIPSIDFWTAFSILLAILMFLYQLRDSAQTESRLVSEIQRSRNEVQNAMQHIGLLLQMLIDSRQPNEDDKVQYVVRSRVAKIRTLPRAGSTRIAEIFPNQVVTLVDESGMWIEVQYFDWLKQEVRTGWVLKKYLVRVPAGRCYSKKEVGNE